ncbi:TetR/AcrR family transcriptional regulator [Geobacter sp. DSM 9736]|uniref:TetR/AcrR family transcriptional regulator n=1 Tax=Geobacter sp. DSM 9736 TaxID=1277350 RepID=UPI000B610AAB|nr:TetR/AcrR family transcriptional regulator [Geobacter sp. DSM 9736]SNB45636.1 transcriptional regulator, TetR family [Geobacter sp. DSM 9736]
MNKRSAEATKQKILDAAHRVFAERGHSEASMRLIASAAGISVGCLYLYFKNKDDLYLTLMQQWIRRLDGETREVLAHIKDPREAVKAFISTTIAFTTGHKEILMLQGKEFCFSFGLDMKRQFFRERRLFLTQLIADGVERGAFCDCNPEEAAKVIFNMLRGYIVSMVIDEEALFSVEDCCSLLLNGLLRRNDG